MTQHLTKNKIACMTTNTNGVHDNTQFICLLSSMPFHRCIPLDLKNYRMTIAYFCSRRIIESCWQNHENVYQKPSKKDK